MKEKVFSSITLSLFLAANASGEPLISEGGVWRYYKGSSMPPLQDGVNWTEVAYNDSTWGGPLPSGFGYGDSDDATVFNDMQNSYASVFLRKTFAVVDPGVITRLTLAVDHDDGFVAYLNGIEVARRSMPAGAVTHATLASGNHEASRGDGGSNPQEKEFITINPALLVAGNNVLAISGHNVSLDSSDFTLVPELYSNVTLVRGPFLQMPTAGAISVAWRTDALTDSAVDYGADTNCTGGTVTDPALVRQHIVTLPALPQGTTMFYRVRSGGVTLAESSFKTPRGSRQPYRFAVYGDFGWSGPQTSAVAFQVNAAEPDLTVTVGDNIYPDGEPGSYDPFWFRPYNAINRRAPLFPALGNHDVDNSSNGQYYIDNFYLPQNGPAGLLERNYSFDYGNAHFAVIETNPFVYRINPAKQTAIKNWLASDLAASTQRWKFVVFHQPAYTSSGGGAHSPATILQNDIAPICAQNGVQMIFQGHSHFYERINPINAVHYITSGAGGRSLHTPTIIPTYSAALKSGVYSFTQIDVNGGQLMLRQIDSAGNQIDSLWIDLDLPFKIDGLLDSPDYLRAQNGLKLYAAIKRYSLYLATQDAGEGNDHFIYLNNQSAPLQNANWGKIGQVMTWSAFLADENGNGFKGWFNATDQLQTNTAVFAATTSGLNNNGATGNGVLEGSIDLLAHFGSFPSQIYLAAAAFGSATGGALVSSAQVPAGNGNGNIEASEFLILNTREIALDVPISNAGPDQNVEAGMQVTLSGAGSSTPSGLPLSYAWTQLFGPAVTINNPNQKQADFTSPANVAQNTDLNFRLRVNDTRFDTDDMVTIQLYPMIDSDGDGLSDQEELTGQNNQLTTPDPADSITNPNLADTDGDGMKDGHEALAETDPNDPASVFINLTR